MFQLTFSMSGSLPQALITVVPSVEVVTLAPAVTTRCTNLMKLVPIDGFNVRGLLLRQIYL